MTKKVTSEANLDTARAKRIDGRGRQPHPGASSPRRPIVAPFSGRAGIRKVEKGQYVSAGMALVSLQALDPIRADFPMPEQHIGKLRVSQPIELTVDAYPGQVFKGRSSRSTRASRRTRARCWCAPSCPTRSASCCRACSPTSPSWWAGAPGPHRSEDRAHLQSVRRQRLRGEAAPTADGAAPPAAGAPAAGKLVWPSARFVAPGQVREDRVGDRNLRTCNPASRSSPPARSSSSTAAT